MPPADAPAPHPVPPPEPPAGTGAAGSSEVTGGPAGAAESSGATGSPGEAAARVPAPRSDADAAVPALTERDLQILAFERRWWKHAGAKEQAIRDTFDLSATRYYQVLNGLLDNPAALAHDALLIGRLRRLRSTRARVRRR